MNQHKASIFKRKRCKQCGWELKLFTDHDCCSEECVYTYVKNKQEHEEYKHEKTNSEVGCNLLGFIKNGEKQENISKGDTVIFDLIACRVQEAYVTMGGERFLELVIIKDDRGFSKLISASDCQLVKK